MTSAAVARRGWVEDHLRARYFTRRGPLRFGAEMELLAFDAVTGAVASIVAPAAGGPSTLAAVRAVGERCGWREGPTSKGVPRFAAPSGGALTFEPGGQLEYASAAHASVDGVLNELCAVHGALVAACDIEGVTLRSIGIDAEHGASEAPLQITTERYRRMDAYFAPIGPAGARMMRQTASFQLCIGGVDIAAGWKAANAIAPWLVAIFANSRRYAGRDTGCASYRAETWRSVDRSRTGLVIGDDPVAAYAEFAVAAPALLAAPEDAAPLSFGDLAAAHATPDALDVHLSTLFPEVRPRGYLELRSMDAVDVGEQAAAMAFAAGLLATDAMARMALEVAGEPSHELLGAAGRSGLNDERLRTRAFALVELALEGCSHLAPAVVSAATLDRARDSFRLLLHERRQAGAMRDQMVPSRSRAIGLGDDAAPSPFASPER